MNERIKQLADEAGLKYHNWITNESNINDGDFKYPRLEDYEKFAQLIVADCVSLCKYDAEDDDDLYDLGMIYKAKEISQLIKKHFGVE